MTDFFMIGMTDVEFKHLRAELKELIRLRNTECGFCYDILGALEKAWFEYLKIKGLGN